METAGRLWEISKRQCAADDPSASVCQR